MDTLDRSTPKSALLGYRTPTGEPVPTPFLTAYEDGGLYAADEADNAPGFVQTLLNSALANGHAPAAWGLVSRHKGFAFVGTGNTPGRPTAAFPDRQPMSAAFKDRLYFLHWPIDPAIEKRAGEASPSAKAWVRWVLSVRAWCEKNAPTLMVTPRASLDGLRALAAGEEPAAVAAGFVFRGADADLTEKVLAANPLPKMEG